MTQVEFVPRVLFCNIAWMENYCGVNGDKIEGNLRYIQQYHTGGEVNNFNPRKDGKVYGFVAPRKRADKPYTIRVENIASDYEKDKIDEVLVIFCARRPKHSCLIVGWYEHATVYRELQGDSPNQYNIVTNCNNVTLVPVSDRKISVPSSKSNFRYGFGQAPIWYAKEPNAQGFVQRVLDYVYSYPYGNYYEDEILTEGGRKQVFVNLYERNAQARAKCIEHYGAKCWVCGFEATDIYGADYTDAIEVHHVLPVSSRNGNYKLNPIDDLKPVCPNCHMILHKKVRGEAISIDDLRKKFRKN
ncbi:TPA: HNH endonuclease [Candidatus Scatousia excrementigallinarum]|uniref:HNH endonuclease n=1 Tax=Candidatus Scatousia excrementigallinarum TaxID=2840935 RepID=A0A9D1EZ30_9BACT|nr:HNH endonuclease [Candidatus Scatousia excrementigallinarum]